MKPWKQVPADEVSEFDVEDTASVGDFLSSFTAYLDVDERVRLLRMLPYRTYLLTDHWRLTRKYALRRAGFSCERCGVQSSLQVHHLTYDRIGAEDDADLEVLCRPCHEAEHGIDHP